MSIELEKLDKTGVKKKEFINKYEAKKNEY